MNMIDKFIKKLESYNSFLIITHENPDGDALGSSVALKRTLELIGKEVDLYAQTPIPVNLEDLIKESDITSLDDLKTGYDVCMCLDCSSEDYLFGGNLKNLCRDIIVIDHHVTNNRYGNINMVSEKASATGELIFMISSAILGTIPKYIASLLYVAISTDTGSFSYSNTTPATHIIGAKLLKCGVEQGKLSEMVKLKDITSLFVRKKSLESIYAFKENQILVMVLDDENINAETDTDGLIDAIRYIKGCKVAALVKRADDESFKVSLRSGGSEVDVASIAHHYGGGGHTKAAGFTFKGSKNEILTAIKDIDLEV